MFCMVLLMFCWTPWKWERFICNIDWTAPLFNVSLFKLETPAVLRIMWMRWCSLKAQSRYMWHIVVQDNHRKTNSDASDDLSTFLHGTIFKLAMRSNLKLETPAVFCTCKSWTRVTPTGSWIQANCQLLRVQITIPQRVFCRLSFQVALRAFTTWYRKPHIKWHCTFQSLAPRIIIILSRN